MSEPKDTASFLRHSLSLECPFGFPDFLKQWATRWAGVFTLATFHATIYPQRFQGRGSPTRTGNGRGNQAQGAHGGTEAATNARSTFEPSNLSGCQGQNSSCALADACLKVVQGHAHHRSTHDDSRRVLPFPATGIQNGLGRRADGYAIVSRTRNATTGDRDNP